jgi:hypothetical protein
MTEKQEKELHERQPSWPARRIRDLSIAGVFILVGAAISGGVAIFTWQYKDLCPEGGECKILVWRPGLLFLGIYALACAAITLWTMIRATRSREVRQLRTAVALLAVTFSLILAVWGTLLIDNSSYKRHEYRPSSDDPCEVYDCNPSSSTPPTEGSSK